MRTAVGERAEDLEMPAENLLQPAVLRQWVWEHEQAPAETEIAAQLTELGARDWQVEQSAPVIHRALTEES